MTFQSGYIYSVKLSKTFRNLSQTLDSRPFTAREFLDLLEVIEEGALTPDRLEELVADWSGSKTILPDDAALFLKLVRLWPIPDLFKTCLRDVVTRLVAANRKSTSLHDRLGLIAGNIYFVQEFLRNQGAQLLNLTFLTHFKKAEKVLELSQGHFARGLSFGIARNSLGLSLCSFYSVDVDQDEGFVSVDASSRFEDALLEDYSQLHHTAIEQWDNRINSVPLDLDWTATIANLLDTECHITPVPVIATPVFHYAFVQTHSGQTLHLGKEHSDKIIVEDRDLFAHVNQFHLVDLLEYLRQIILIFMDVSFVNSEETVGVIPIAYRDEVYLIIEYGRLAPDGKHTHRLGSVYHVEEDPFTDMTLHELVKEHISTLSNLYEDFKPLLEQDARQVSPAPA